MKTLKLPVVKIPPARQKILSMDHYLAFVQFNLPYVDKAACKKWKKLLAVDVPFSIH